MTAKKAAAAIGSKPRRSASKPKQPTPAKSKPDLTLSGFVKSSVAAASWLSETDHAAVALAVTLAKTIEDMEQTPEGVKAAAPAFTVLARLLNDLGLTSKGRPDTGTPNEGVTWLDDLRKNAIWRN